MKTNLFQLSLLFLLCTSVLCGCANDDEQILSTDGSTLTVHATANGFASADGVNTRASEDDYNTTFTEGDQIGVFAVKDGQVIEDCKNVPLTYNGTGWEGNAVYYYTGAEYFAYYPYDVNMKDKTNVDDIVKDFIPQTDQSSYEDYTKSDLMTAEATPASDKTLSFSFVHKMSLIEISLPVQKYTTGGESPYEYSSPVIGATFSIASGSDQQSITPYNMGGGVYRYIVPAGVSHTVGGEFQTGDGKTIEYSKVRFSLSAGNYKRLNVSYDGAPSGGPQERALAIGDFYYSDGNICPGDASNPPLEGCIGIVMKVGRDSESTWEDDCTYKLKDGITEMNTVHGYVLALHDANNGETCEWGSYGTQVEYEGMMNRDQNTGFYGYKNTQAVILFAKSKVWNLQDTFPAVYWGTNGYEDSHPAPENSSGWFLPSAGQCQYWLNNRDELLESVKKVTGEDSYGWKNWYWSSSEISYNPTGYAWYANFFYGYVYNYRKYYSSYVRACLAF